MNIKKIKNGNELRELSRKKEEEINKYYEFDSVEDLKKELTVQDYALLFKYGYSINDLYYLNLKKLKNSELGKEIISILVLKENKLNKLYEEYGDLCVESYDYHPDGDRYKQIDTRLKEIDEEIKSLRGGQNA